MFEVIKNEIWTFVQSVLSLYIVVNPSGVSSVFLGLTKSSDAGERRRIALTAAVTGAVALALFAIAGSTLFRVFHITGATLQIAGGIFVFGFAFALARGKEQEFFGITGEAYKAGAPKSVAFYPLASPLIAGPASITLVMTLSAKAESPKSWIVLILAIGIVAFLCALSMWRVLHLSERLGPALSLITPRLMGLILAVIAVQFILEGVIQILPRLAAAAKGG
jgi:multiple antibiotic resistance protein